MTHIFKILFLLLLISCKKKEKEWTCTCEIHGTTNRTITKKITTESKTDADTECSEYGQSEMGSAHHFECDVQ